MTGAETDMTAGEGVNEGSKALTAETPSDQEGTVQRESETSGSGPTSESDPAPPGDVGSAATAAGGGTAPGQQLEAGEG